ncbi:MAG: R.Pab1 family restriction endonuclease [Candidatus Portiera sp.]|nr:R.Pab1 family restriction endonuclease [Portiera sp.]
MLKPELPITKPTGNVRVKTRTSPLDYGIPVTTAASNPNASALSTEHYLEWMIAYYAAEKYQSESRIEFTRDGKSKYFCELSDYLYQGFIEKTISKKEITELLEEVRRVKEENNFIETEHDIDREKDEPIKFGELDLLLYKEQHPLLLYIDDDNRFSIEVKINHKQRAVGLQAMVFVCIPLSSFENSKDFIGRKATTNEHITLDTSKINFIIPALKIFSRASLSHNLDIEAILLKIIEDR